MIKNFNELIEKIKNETVKKTVAVVAAHDLHTLEAVDIAYKKGIIAPILIGDCDKIKELITTHGFQFKDAEIYEAKDNTEAAKKAVSMIREGAADILMKGKLQTATLLREIVNRERGLQTGRIMSHFGIFEIPGYHKLLVLTDGGMLPHPNINQKVQILMNAVDTLHFLGYKNPKVAVLTATEVVNPKIPESVDGGLLKKMNEEGTLKGCIVEGPISYDLMISPESAKVKGYESSVTGDADILLMPNMTSGNLLGKALRITAGAKMAGIIVGSKVPIVLASRSATAEEKYLSLVLSVASTQRQKEETLMNYKILAINPGSTSTKIAVYENENRIFSENVEHTAEELNQFDDILDQTNFRAQTIHSILKKHNIELSELSGVAGRGGLLPNMLGGGYIVTDTMIDALYNGEASPHASNLGALLASEIAGPLGINAYIYDAVTATEFPEIAIVTGMPDVRRQSACHVLNMKSISRKVAKKYGKSYEDMHLLVAHLGGGISISAHEGGKIVDSISDDSGPFGPERSGSVPLLYVIEMCYSGKYNKKEMISKIRGRGGLKAYFGTADCREIEKMIAEGNEKARLMYEAMAYQIAKGIGQLGPVLKGKVDYIILTGGLAYSEMLTGMIAERVSSIAPVEIMPGEDEMEALALGILRILRGEETSREYQPV